MGNKYKSKLKKKTQNKSGVYSSTKKGGGYDDLSATKKTTGVDKGGLTSNKAEKRGRPKSDAPRGKRKTTKKGRK